MSAALVIPFRDRGRDPLRSANLAAVLNWWQSSPWPVYVVGDDRSGDAQFNRHIAYNRAATKTSADVLVYTEADMLIPFEQIEQAITMATTMPGLVVPFTQYRYLSEVDSGFARDGAQLASLTPERTMDDGRSIGAVNAVSRDTLTAVGGYTERTEGNWYDDRIMHHAFDVCAGPTRWVDGPAFHLYHLPGWKGEHLTAEDRAATKRNRALWRHVQHLQEPALVRAALHP